MERLEDKDRFEEMTTTQLVEFINETYNKRQSMDLSYSYKEEIDLTRAMNILDKRTGYGIR